jgi:hypothetical protein
MELRDTPTIAARVAFSVVPSLAPRRPADGPVFAAQPATIAA